MGKNFSLKGQDKGSGKDTGLMRDRLMMSSGLLSLVANASFGIQYPIVEDITIFAVSHLLRTLATTILSLFFCGIAVRAMFAISGHTKKHYVLYLKGENE